MKDTIPDEVRRFLLTSIPSVPHLELLMLLWRDKREFALDEIARRLYIGPVAAATLADDLLRAELLVQCDKPDRFAIRKEPEELVRLLDVLDRIYSRQVRAVAEVVHGNLGRKAHNFAQAFVWRKS